MMRKVAVSVFVFAAWVAWATPLAAQTISKAPPTYEPSTEITITGTVVNVISAAGTEGAVGVHLNLQNAAGKVVMVHLGPAMFIGMNNFSFLMDDAITVTGAFVSHAGDIALWARTVTKGENTLTLRSEDGTPRWPYATVEDPDGCGISHAPIR
jgi:hypothetical protein